MSDKSIWKAGPEITKTVLDLIKKHHPRLLLVQDEIAVVMKEKASTPGGVVVYGKSGKAPPLLAALTATDWKFVITLAADTWNELSPTQQMALIDHHLCSMVIEEDPDQGTIKCSIRPPEGWYREEVERWGFWRPMCDPDAKTPVEQMFGAEEKEQEATDGE
jgi:hypothetical protein